MEYNIGENCGSGSETRKATVELVCDDNEEMDDYDDDIDTIINNNNVNVDDINTNDNNIEVNSNNNDNNNDNNNNRMDLDNDLNDYYRERYRDYGYDDFDHYNDYHDEEASYYRQNYEGGGEYGDDGFFEDLSHSMSEGSQGSSTSIIDSNEHDILSADEDYCHTRLKLKIPISCHLLIDNRHKDDRVGEEAVISNVDKKDKDESTNNDKDVDKCNCNCEINNINNYNEGVDDSNSIDEIDIDIEGSTTLNDVTTSTTSEKSEMIEVLLKQVDDLKKTVDALKLT
jgi:hypothetical protein